jgi:prepilin-type N-terminal cleavage/methylation domain-containing protein
MRKGFTLIELMVVIGIMAILTALTIPMAQSLVENNRVSACVANLQKIGHALKLYSADYEGVPGVWIADPGHSSTPYALMTNPATVVTGDPNTVTPPTAPPPNPLMVLYTEQYLKSNSVFHCPRDRAHEDSSQPSYYASYTGLDDATGTAAIKTTYQNDQPGTDSWGTEAIPVNAYKYMPCRIFRLPLLANGSTDPNETHTWANPPSVYTDHQELSAAMKPVQINGNWYWTPTVDRTWWPSDNTVVCWCPFHANTYSVDGQGQYLVLFWDGSVLMKKRTLFETGTTSIAPPAAWEVTPSE